MDGSHSFESIHSCFETYANIRSRHEEDAQMANLYIFLHFSHYNDRIIRNLKISSLSPSPFYISHAHSSHVVLYMIQLTSITNNLMIMNRHNEGRKFAMQWKGILFRFRMSGIEMSLRRPTVMTDGSRSFT
jgi:hypothetical protein